MWASIPTLAFSSAGVQWVPSPTRRSISSKCSTCPCGRGRWDAPLSQVRSGVGTREGLLKGPIRMALTARGTLLVLETFNNRIQAFDIGGNPMPYCANPAYFAPLKDPQGAVTYLDLAVEYSGYLYVLSYTG
jgi:hypothetical protein